MRYIIRTIFPLLLLLLWQGLSIPAFAGEPDHVSVSAVYSGITVTLGAELFAELGGYRSVPFRLQNHDALPHRVTVLLRNSGPMRYLSTALYGISGAVTVPPHGESVLTLTNPGLPIYNLEGRIRVDGCWEKLDKKLVASAFGPLRNYGYGPETILVSPKIPGNSGTFWNCNTAWSFQPVSHPVEQWSGDFRAYLGAVAVLLSDAEWRSLPDPVRNALQNYAALGGTLIVQGTGELPLGTEVESGTDWRIGKLQFGTVAAVENVAALQTDKTSGLLPHLQQYWERPFNACNANVKIDCAMILKGRNGEFPLAALVKVLVVFAVIAGPVNYWMLYRKKRLMLLLFTTPLIALLFAAGLAAWSLFSEGTRMDQGRLAVTMLDQPGKIAATRSWWGICSTATVGDVQWRASTAVQAGPGFGKGELEESDGIRWRGGWFAPRIPALARLLKAEPCEKQLCITARGASWIEVENRLGAPITELRLCQDNKSCYRAKTVIAPGARGRLDRCPQPENRSERMFFYRSLRNWAELAKFAAGENRNVPLAPGEYVAWLDGAPFVEKPCGSDTCFARSVVLGRFAAEEIGK